MPAGKCARCGARRRWLHRHRHIPGAEGGEYVPENIELICANCHEDEHGSPYGQAARAKRRRAAREQAIPEPVLRDMYEKQRLSIREIGGRLGTAPSNVQFWMADYGIERRAVGRVQVFSVPRKDLQRLYETMTLDQMATHYGVSREIVRRRMLGEGIALRARGARPIPASGREQ